MIRSFGVEAASKTKRVGRKGVGGFGLGFERKMPGKK